MSHERREKILLVRLVLRSDCARSCYGGVLDGVVQLVDLAGESVVVVEGEGERFHFGPRLDADVQLWGKSGARSVKSDAMRNGNASKHSATHVGNFESGAGVARRHAVAALAGVLDQLDAVVPHLVGQFVHVLGEPEPVLHLRLEVARLQVFKRVKNRCSTIFIVKDPRGALSSTKRSPSIKSRAVRIRT